MAMPWISFLLTFAHCPKVENPVTDYSTVPVLLVRASRWLSIKAQQNERGLATSLGKLL